MGGAVSGEGKELGEECGKQEVDHHHDEGPDLGREQGGGGGGWKGAGIGEG